MKKKKNKMRIYKEGKVHDEEEEYEKRKKYDEGKKT